MKYSATCTSELLRINGNGNSGEEWEHCRKHSSVKCLCTWKNYGLSATSALHVVNGSITTLWFLWQGLSLLFEVPGQWKGTVVLALTLAVSLSMGEGNSGGVSRGGVVMLVWQGTGRLETKLCALHWGELAVWSMGTWVGICWLEALMLPHILPICLPCTFKI